MNNFKFTSEITVTPIQQMGSDAIIAGAAWVSTSADKALEKIEGIEQVSGLINYLMKHRHGSPFEHGALTVYVHAPIFVWREWHRHRIASYNEESARYKTLEPVFYIPPVDRPMMKVDNWKPGRPKFLTLDEYSNSTEEREHIYETLSYNLERSYKISYDNYIDNLNMGIDPGLARDCLPVGIYSSCWVTMNPRAIMNFLSLRTHREDADRVSYPLYEIEQAANKLELIFKEYWPITYEAFNKNGRVAP